MQNLDDIKLGTLHPDGTLTPPEAVPFDEVWEDYESSLYQSRETYNNGDFDYRFMLETVKLPDEEDQWMVCLSVVKTFKSLPRKKQEDLREHVGKENTPDESDIHSYGLAVPIESCTCTEEEIEAKKQELTQLAPRVRMLFGFYMDRPVNRIGTKGWDWLNGDVMAGLRK